MIHNSIEDYKNYINEQLIDNLPLNYRKLEYITPELFSESPTLNIIEIPFYKTKSYFVYPFHRPISKCIDNLSNEK